MAGLHNKDQLMLFPIPNKIGISDPQWIAGFWDLLPQLIGRWAVCIIIISKHDKLILMNINRIYLYRILFHETNPQQQVSAHASQAGGGRSISKLKMKTTRFIFLQL